MSATQILPTFWVFLVVFQNIIVSVKMGKELARGGGG